MGRRFKPGFRFAKQILSERGTGNLPALTGEKFPNREGTFQGDAVESKEIEIVDFPALLGNEVVQPFHFDPPPFFRHIESGPNSDVIFFALSRNGMRFRDDFLVSGSSRIVHHQIDDRMQPLGGIGFCLLRRLGILKSLNGLSGI